nr:hypothetical protein [Micromonospora sp. HNM0581]
MPTRLGHLEAEQPEAGAVIEQIAGGSAAAKSTAAVRASSPPSGRTRPETRLI